MKTIIYLSILILFASKVFGHDLGVYSTVYEIDEVNLKELIAEELKNVNTNLIQNKLEENVKNYGNRLNVNNLNPAQITKTFYYDPSISLSKNIIIRGQILYKKGTKVNPLEYVRPPTNLLFFDGTDKEQTAFALKVLKSEPYRITLVMTKGNPIKLAEDIHRPIYYAVPGIIERFHIVSLPSLLGVGKGKHEKELAVTSITKPYTESTITECWNGCPEINSKVQKK